MFQGSSIVGGSSSGQPDSSSGREELLYGARQPESKGKGGVRSAAEIRSAYGRSSTRYAFFSIYNFEQNVSKTRYVVLASCSAVALYQCDASMYGSLAVCRPSKKAIVPCKLLHLKTKQIM
jgi:hypothetical protein